jgi:hypothetical protein
MKRSPWVRGALLAGLVAVSLALYWAADAASHPLEIALLTTLAGLALLAIWVSK